MGKTTILILMATHNGAKFLQEQLDSFLAQTDSDWELLVSDDGSCDATIEILHQFKSQVKESHIVTIVQGPGAGSAHNFLSLIKQVPKGTHFIAFSDQDDVWLPEKLERARQKIGAELHPETPILYAASSFICDASLASKKLSPALRWDPSFGNSLVQSIGGGNTMVLNRPAIQLLRASAHEACDVVFHDWWTYQIILGCGGAVHRDDMPVLYYRQHGENLIGANNLLRGKVQRFLFIFERGFVKWNDQNIASLNASRHRFTSKAKRSLSYYINSRRGSLPKRIVALYRSGAIRQRRSGTIALYLACVVGRL